MSGCLTIARSLVYVGSEEKTARVRVFDLDGHPVGEGFTFRDPRLGRSVAAGIAVDDDHRVWVADTPASRVRRFTLFGREEGGLGVPLDAPLEEHVDTRAHDRALTRPVAVAVTGNGEEGRIVVGCAGERRHAVHVFEVPGGASLSLRPCGDPHGRFRGVRGVALCGRFLYVAEADGERIQVFRDDAFHFAFGPRAASGAVVRPVAVAPLDDGRMVVAVEGDEHALLLVDSAGRVLAMLAGHGRDTGRVDHPSDLAVEEGERDATTRVLAIDRDGQRVQVFTLEGRCYGAFAERA